ncbi:MAG: aromatic ring-hydroxylating dioxygenase subunit alpha [Actinomycetota bacterium]|nr:aromatic ring-hydroxylating dioxygenase subunit alpha [Actinomycetota bacterium]
MASNLQSRPVVDDFAHEGIESWGKLRQYWHPVALSDEITEQPRRFVLLAEPLVLYRVNGKVACFKDLCIHRGAALSLGKVTPNGTLQCPYHGWEYDTTGACVKIPAKGDNTTIPRKAHAIAYRAEEQYGAVWVALDDPIYPIPPFPHGEYDDPGWHAFLAFSPTWKTSAGRVMENFCDWSHIPFVHEGTLGRPDIPRPAEDPTPVWEHAGEEGYSLGYAYEQIDQSQLVGQGGKLSIRREFVVYLPFTTHIYKINPDGKRLLLTLIVSPTTPKESRLFYWICRDYLFDTPDEDFRQTHEEVFAEDQVVVESQRPEEIPVDLKEELHIKLPDAFSIEYRRVLQRIAESAEFLPY